MQWYFTGLNKDQDEKYLFVVHENDNNNNTDLHDISCLKIYVIFHIYIMNDDLWRF